MMHRFRRRMQRRTGERRQGERRLTDGELPCLVDRRSGLERRSLRDRRIADRRASQY